MKFLKYIVVFVFFVFPFIGSAQLAHLDNLDLKISPEYPKAQQIVTVEAEFFSFNENQAYFTWYIDGTIKEEGSGLSEIQLSLGRANVETVVTLIVTTENNVTLEEQITIQPTDITLLWEASTDIPLFYKGKSLHTAGSDIKFVAIPNIYQNGRKVSSRNLVYTWEKNGRILGSLSGLGKSSVTLENDKVLKNLNVSVVVETADQLVSGKDSLSVSVGKTDIVLYKDDALLGVRYDNSIRDTFNLNENSITIISEPFFFSSGENLNYSWKINGDDTDNSSNFISLNAPSDGEGDATISVDIKNTESFLQIAKKTFKIEFGKPFLESLFNF